MNLKNTLFTIGILFCTAQIALSQTANPNQYKYTFTVAQDGSGDFSSIQDAIDAMRVYPLAPIILYIKNGVYKEKIVLPATKTDVTFIGESVDKTIIIYDDYSGKGKLTTFNSFTVKISGNRFRAENISFVNAAGPVGQAVALYVDADKAVFKNCRFLGNQDTIFASGENARQYFDSCYIEGTTDFIFGPSTAVFKNCLIKCKADSYITAPNTIAGNKYGFTFLQCKIMVDSGVTKVYLGRPWRSFARSVFIQCELPAQIAAEGWDNWSNPQNEKTTYFGEFQNRGDGAKSNSRVKWAKKLTKLQAKQYNIRNIFNTEHEGDSMDLDWYQKKSVAFHWPN